MLWPQKSGYGVQRETSGSVLVLNMDVDRDSRQINNFTERSLNSEVFAD